MTGNSKNIDEKEVENMLKLNKNYYNDQIVEAENEIRKLKDRIALMLGTKEVETGMAPPSLWNLSMDRQTFQSDPSLQVCKVIKKLNDPSAQKYIISIRQMAKFVVAPSKHLKNEDITEGMRVGVDRVKYSPVMPLPRKIDSAVSLMQIEDKPDITYADIGGYKNEISKIREVVEEPMVNPEKFIKLGIDPPKGILLYGPPGTGKTLVARAVANRTDACFIRVIGSELVQKYIGEGARMIREIFDMAKTKKACIIFFDEVDVFGGTRYGGGDDNEVQRTMLELINQLDGFSPRGHVKVIMATNRPDTLDPALLRPGRLDRKLEFGLPDLEGRRRIFEINSKVMSVDKNIRYDLLARMCNGATGAEISSVCTEAGMLAIRSRKKIVTEKNYFGAIEKVIVRDIKKFSSTSKYLQYN